MCEAIDHRTEDLCITSMGMYDEYGTFQGAKNASGNFEDLDDSDFEDEPHDN